jgi:MraZ protein
MQGCNVGGSGICSPQRAGVEGLLPLLHLGSNYKLPEPSVVPFRGTFDHTLDAKNRLTVPARYRAALAEGVVLAKPLDLKPCVGVWRPEEYESYTRRALAELPPLSPRLTELERFLYGSSHDAELDAAGRIMIPNAMREDAHLAKDVIVVGVGDRLELWDKGAWNSHRSTLLSGVAEVTARVDDAA